MKLNKDANKKEDNYMVLGMCFGVCVGAVGMVFLACFGQIAWGGLSVGLGLISGMAIGACVKKNDK